MPTDCISYQNSGFLLLMNDYLDQKNNLHSLYNRTIENFEGQILEKQANYDDSNRVAFGFTKTICSY
jgi:hypothetical protein